ncbi:MAG TPA: hypothetical protein GXX77_08050 [Candidatus Cloacimonetes bacterium]|nr:hypothetical protein [Candidatus Cloacimonadota bacterium]
MSKRVNIELIADKLPVKYRYKQFARWAGLFLSAVLLAYCLYFMVYFIDADANMFVKILTLTIAFVAVHTIIVRVTDVNSITFEDDGLKISYLGRASRFVEYNRITEIRLEGKMSFSLIANYLDDNGNNKSFTLKPSFPHKPEILLNLVEFSPNAKTAEEINRVVEVLRTGALQSVRHDYPEKE